MTWFEDEKYFAVNIDKNDNILDFVNKSNEGYERTFIGLVKYMGL
jgi:hypothetical protein